jgi:hypothetical protein
VICVNLVKVWGDPHSQMALLQFKMLCQRRFRATFARLAGGDWVPELIRYLLRHKIRTALTVLAIAVGVFAVGGIAEYLDVLVVRPAVENARGRVRVAPKEWEQPLTPGSLRQLRRIEGVAGVTAQPLRTVYLQDGQVVREERWA